MKRGQGFCISGELVGKVAGSRTPPEPLDLTTAAIAAKGSPVS